MATKFKTVPLITGTQLASQFAQGKVGMSQPTAENCYKENRDKLISAMYKMNSSIQKKNMNVFIILGTVKAETQLKSGLRTTTATAEEYFKDRYLFTLPERRLVMQLIKEYDKDLDSVYSAMLGMEFIITSLGSQLP